ncbi:NAD(P)H-binding protein [Nonomuraea sp. NPDC049152]|uniref:NAD(P)H-binding protein n=1 Tax=Nonomuraea sp. NPDC049152 TaxID=3154350 RepID=UPI0033F95C4E
MAGADAVISIINGGDSRDPHHAAQATRTVIQAMTESGARRLVVTTPYPIVARQPHLSGTPTPVSRVPGLARFMLPGSQSGGRQ